MRFPVKSFVVLENLRIFAIVNPQNAMNDDLFQPVPQGSIGAQDAENRRINAIADELRRRCKLYEAQRGDRQPHVISFEDEQRAAETFAKEHGLWLPMDLVFDLAAYSS